MTHHPLVSIVTVVYNGVKDLQQTIDSVVNQTYKNIEYIVIDGGSNDGTVELIKANEKHIDYWVSEPDNGLYDAMNKGIIKASGEIVGIINSDDWYELNAIECVVKSYLKHSDKTIFHANRFDVLPDGSKREYKFNASAFKFKYFNMTYSHPSMFITKTEYQKHLYSTELKTFSDYQFILESFLDNPDTFFHIDKSLVNFRLGGMSGQVSFIEELREGDRVRKNVGMSLFERIFTMVLKTTTKPLLIVKQKLKK